MLPPAGEQDRPIPSVGEESQVREAELVDAPAKGEQEQFDRTSLLRELECLALVPAAIGPPAPTTIAPRHERWPAHRHRSHGSFALIGPRGVMMVFVSGGHD